jgi:DNA-binding HxlR family transcriptional regulator
MQNEPSFHHFQVQHFCPVAQALEQVGDRWSWLIVRDLMRRLSRNMVYGLRRLRILANL